MDVETLGDPGDPAILLIEDAGGSPGWWDDDVCRRLAAAPRFVIRYDRAVEASSRAVADLAADAVGVLDALGIQRTHLVGGAVAWQIAVLRPERVESLALTGTTTDGPPEVAIPTIVFYRASDPPPATARVTPVPVPGSGRVARDAVATALLRQTSGGWDRQGDRLAARAIAAGDPTGWFDRLYAAGATGEVDMPWDRKEPHPLLAEWAQRHGVRGDGRRAVVSGCGLGADAEFLAALGFRTVGFDVSATAVRVARERHPGSTVDYRVGDLLNLPAEWVRSFDLVVDVFTVQALPDPPRRTAIANVGRLVAPGGSLVVVAFRSDGTEAVAPPWPLTSGEVDAFATDGLDAVRVEEVVDPRREHSARWRAEFRRPGSGGPPVG